ncbi:MAG: diacylglycerol kinase family protein [Dysgonamonadaceae bacterium]|jgi:diacylglycerol kinase|nr:diacylglycerol kinase family protein [Dysgonamonadaceae bacterium]
MTQRQKQSQIQSFRVAFEGIGLLIREQLHFRIHLIFAAFALIACGFFQVTRNEWIAVLILIALVLATEAANTCLEYLCDLVSPGYHPLVKKIKDMAAGMVLLSAIIAVVAGCLIFIPYIIQLWV